MRSLHQFIPTLANRDAVGRHTVALQALLHARGVHSEIFTEHPPAADVQVRTRPFQSFGSEASDRDAALLYQASTGSPIAEWLLDRDEQVIINYHNITPPEFFQRWEPHVAAELRVGRYQLEELASVAEFGIADSEYNARELDDIGYMGRAVVPILFDPATVLGLSASALHHRDVVASGAQWLFVGRLAPNKCQQDIVKAFAYFRAVYDPGARLTLVGKSSSHAFQAAVLEFVTDLGLDAAVRVVEDATPAELSEHFAAADVFVCLSEHEGFCVPLLEAMANRVPIVAFRAGAVPDTAGAAAVMLETKQPSVVAAAVHRVCTDRALAAALVAAGQKQLASFELERTQRAMWDVLEPFVG